MSFIFAKDAAEATLRSLTHEKAVGGTYNLAAPEVLTFGGVVSEITRQLGVKSLALPLPASGMWLVCAMQELLSKLSGKPNILSRGKYP